MYNDMEWKKKNALQRGIIIAQLWQPDHGFFNIIAVNIAALATR
jgi:hypothetical protein